MFHTIVSIKNDGHYFCRAGGNRPDGLNEPVTFKRESAQLVVDQNYTVADAAKAMDVGLSTMTRWVKQLRDERQGKTPKASPITPEQIEIRELRKKRKRTA